VPSPAPTNGPTPTTVIEPHENRRARPWTSPARPKPEGPPLSGLAGLNPDWPLEPQQVVHPLRRMAVVGLDDPHRVPASLTKDVLTIITGSHWLPTEKRTPQPGELVVASFRDGSLTIGFWRSWDSEQRTFTVSNGTLYEDQTTGLFIVDTDP
jgi:hypothetical protein